MEVTHLDSQQQATALAYAVGGPGDQQDIDRGIEGLEPSQRQNSSSSRTPPPLVNAFGGVLRQATAQFCRSDDPWMARSGVFPPRMRFSTSGGKKALEITFGAVFRRVA